MRRLLFWTTGLALILGIAGCGSSSSKPEQVHGQPIEHWLQVLRQPNAAKRKQAVRVLGNVGMSEGDIMSALIQAVRDPAPEVRLEAVTALEKLGPNAKDAIPALTNAQRDEDPRVQSRAKEALRRVSAS